MNCSLPGSSGHGILQARILEWVSVPSSRVVPIEIAKIKRSAILRNSPAVQWLGLHTHWGPEDLGLILGQGTKMHVANKKQNKKKKSFLRKRLVILIADDIEQLAFSYNWDARGKWHSFCGKYLSTLLSS